MSHAEKVAIVGSGLIGRCWAILFARAGLQVSLYDIEQSQLTAALSSTRQQLEDLASSGLLQELPSVVANRISATTDLLEAIRGAIHLQECVPEQLDLKRTVFQTIDAACTAVDNHDIVLSSSSSCLVPSSFSETLQHRSQVLVSHPINPPTFIPVVEIVPAPWTSESVRERTRLLMLRINQAPVCLNVETDGFVVNRLQYALLMEAYRLVEEGICSPEDVDTSISQGLALRWSFMGPFETIHLNAPKGAADYFQRYAAGADRVLQKSTPPHLMQGETVNKIATAMEKAVPLDKLQERMKWRDQRLAALHIHKQMQASKEGQKSDEPQ